MARAGAKRKIREEDLHPTVARGLTQDVSAEEALTHFKPRGGSGVEVVQHMHKADRRLERARGVPYAAFVAESNTSAVWVDGVTDRPQMDYTKTYTPEGVRLLREGRQCLRCDEPLEIPFPVACPLCGYSVKERQIMDIAVEFEGEKNLGPSKAIGEHLNEIEMRTEKRRFIDKVMEGGQGSIPKAWLRDAHLFPDGPPAKLG